MFLVQLLDDESHEIWRSYVALNVAKRLFVWKRYSIGPLWGDSNEASVILISKIFFFVDDLNPGKVT